MDDSSTMNSATLATKTRTRNERVGNPNVFPSSTKSGSSWLGRVQKMRRKFGYRWVNSQTPIDLLNRPTGNATCIEVLLNWFSKSRGNLKFKYDVSDSQWIDVDSIISIVTMSYSTLSCLYTLNRNDADSLNAFLKL